MTQDPPPKAAPLQRLYDLSDLSEAGAEIAIIAGPEDLAALAEWFQVEKLERFEAIVTLKRKAAGRFLYEAELTADLVQLCVVSLEPVPSHHAIHVTRVLHLQPRAARQRRPEEEGGEITLATGEDDVPEELSSPRYDLAGPLLEDLSLDIDPYPRAEGVEFEIPDEHRPQKESPFAALKRLKEGGA
jgi:hypothetical protein